MSVVRTLSARAAHALETGALDSRFARALSSVWAACAEPRRSVELPRGVAVVGIGGATLGGSGKTPLVVALATALAARGTQLAVVAHAHGAPRLTPRLVRGDDAARAVGDDAVVLARALTPLGVSVVAGSSRAASLRLAASLAPLVVVDGLLQTSPVPLALSLLVLDGARPFGAGRSPPAGDLRAPSSSLVAMADVLVRICADGAPLTELPASPLRPLFDVRVHLEEAVRADGTRVLLSGLASRSVGVVLAVARPERVLASLAHAGIAADEVRLHRDHATPRARRAPRRVPDLWLATEKCVTKLGATFEGRPVLTLTPRLEVPDELVERVRSLGDRAREGTLASAVTAF